MTDVGDDTRAYHARELEIALSPDDPNRVMPRLPPAARRILDVGCGAGQTLVGLELSKDVLSVGLDRDADALALGRSWTPAIHFVAGAGEALPFPDESFDFVLSRVALPYMNIPAAIREIGRVLGPDGHVWVALQPFWMTRAQLGSSVRALKPRAAAFQTYSLINGVVFHATGRLLPCPFLGGRYESFQSAGRMARLLESCGFGDVALSNGRHFVIAARKLARSS